MDGEGSERAGRYASILNIMLNNFEKSIDYCVFVVEEMFKAM